MYPVQKSPRHRLSVFIAAIVLSLSFLPALSGASAAESLAESQSEPMPGSDRAPLRPHATFFSINQVLAKLDRERGRGPNALRVASLAPSNTHTTTDAQPEVKEAPALGQEPFGLFTFRAPDGLLWRKWRGIEADLAKEQLVLEHCRTNSESCPPHAAQFLRLITAVEAKSARGQLEEVNRAVNLAIRYASDFAQHGEADRWSAPLATFAVGKGDCEDYAIAKYVALTEAGFPRDQLRLILVRDRAVRQDHAVLAARLDGGRWLILDSRRSELMHDSDATSFTPLFAINYRGVQLFAAPYAKRPLLADEVDVTPASATTDNPGEWTGLPISNGSISQSSRLPWVM